MSKEKADKVNVNDLKMNTIIHFKTNRCHVFIGKSNLTINGERLYSIATFMIDPATDGLGVDYPLTRFGTKAQMISFLKSYKKYDIIKIL